MQEEKFPSGHSKDYNNLAHQSSTLLLQLPLLELTATCEKGGAREVAKTAQNQFKFGNTPTKNYGPSHNDKMYSFNAETELAQNNVSQKSLIHFSALLIQN